MPIPSARLALAVHLAFETLAYTLAFVIYRRERRQDSAAPFSPNQNLGLLLGAALGALIGAKLLAWIEAPVDLRALFRLAPTALEGKTIVGGILGGWVGVEIAKRRLGIHRPTGDAFAPALVAGLAVGRVGCFLAGFYDRTYGSATSLPWGIDFGDGVPRHPTQLYEIGFLLILAVALRFARRTPRPAGELFLICVMGYFTFRFLIEFLKPRHLLAGGLSAIQIASFLGAAAAGVAFGRRRAGWLPSPPEHAIA